MPYVAPTFHSILCIFSIHKKRIIFGSNKRSYGAAVEHAPANGLGTYVCAAAFVLARCEAYTPDQREFPRFCNSYLFILYCCNSEATSRRSSQRRSLFEPSPFSPILSRCSLFEVGTDKGKRLENIVSRYVCIIEPEIYVPATRRKH